MNRVAFVKTDGRSRGVTASIAGLGINPVKGKDVLIKPNFNTADPCPGSTHNDTLAALIDELWEMGAKSISLGERSYPPTIRVMAEKEIIPRYRKEMFGSSTSMTSANQTGLSLSQKTVTGRMGSE